MLRRIDFTAGFCILWAFLLLVLPLRLILASMTAAVFHELCHFLALRIMGGQVYGVTIGAGGMVMDTAIMTPQAEAVCALAGPAGSFLLVLLCRRLPLLSLCALIQGCFNLLPIYPLDGGRTVRAGWAVLKNTLQSDVFRSTIGEE